MIREQLLETWTTLKAKLSLYPALLKNKELIKDALEIHANRSSEILSNHNSRLVSFQRDSRLAPLSQEFTKVIDLSELEQQFGHTLRPVNPSGYFLLKEHAAQWNSFFWQRQKNQQIIEDCKQLITKLTEF